MIHALPDHNRYGSCVGMQLLLSKFSAGPFLDFETLIGSDSVHITMMGHIYLVRSRSELVQVRKIFIDDSVVYCWLPLTHSLDQLTSLSIG